MAKKIGLDLGSDYTRISLDNGNLFRAPSVIVMDKYAETVAAAGTAARKMLGKTPDHMEAICPIRGGVIANGTACSDMLRAFFEQTDAGTNLDVVVAVPGGITAMEESNLRQAVFAANVKHVTLVDATICAAIGSGLQFRDVRGSMIVDLGGGQSRAAVVSLADVARFSSVASGGDEMDMTIVNYLKETKNVVIGLQIAEYLKRQIGSTQSGTGSATVIGQDVNGGGIRALEITTADIKNAISGHVSRIVNLINKTLSMTPPELCADIGDHGIMLTGGISCMHGIGQTLQERIKVRVTRAKEPQDVIIRGIRQIIQSGKEAEYGR